MVKHELNTSIKLFRPPKYEPNKYGINNLDSVTGKKFLYASKGRHAIGHIISALNPRNNVVLLSPYMCPTVEKKLNKMNYKILYYDIDVDDLNPNPESITEQIARHSPGIVIAASLYGNPADLESIETICANSEVLMIDDAAQSFGAKIGDRWVGCFGNGGLFSFSPGKATAGHMGAFFWTENKQYSFVRTHHPLLHKICYYDYYYNRINIYNIKNSFRSALLKYTNMVLQRIVSIENDDIELFENEQLGGILNCVFNGTFLFRSNVFNEFYNLFADNDLFKVVHSKRGFAVPHKIVLIFNRSAEADKFCQKMKEKSIFTYRGYVMLKENLDKFPGCQKVNNCVVELPIENNSLRMQYLLDSVYDYTNGKKAF